MEREKNTRALSPQALIRRFMSCKNSHLCPQIKKDTLVGISRLSYKVLTTSPKSTTGLTSTVIGPKNFVTIAVLSASTRAKRCFVNTIGRVSVAGGLELEPCRTGCLSPNSLFLFFNELELSSERTFHLLPQCTVS